MSVTDFGDPHQVIHIPACDLTMLLLLGIALWASPVRGQTGAAARTPPTPQQSEASAVQEQSDDLWRGLVFGATIETFYVGLGHGQNTAHVGGDWWFGNKPGAWQEV